MTRRVAATSLHMYTFFFFFFGQNDRRHCNIPQGKLLLVFFPNSPERYTQHGLVLHNAAALAESAAVIRYCWLSQD